MKCILESSKSPMSFFNSLIGIGDDIRSSFRVFKPKEVAKGPYLKGSISNYAKDLTMTFPVLCDNSIDPDTASMLSRAIERHIVNMLELLFASAQFNAHNGADVIRSIFRDVHSKMSLDDYLDALNNLEIEESADIDAAALREAVDKMVKELKTVKEEFDVESFSEKSINDYLVANMNGVITIRERSALNEANDKLNIPPGYHVDPNSIDPYHPTYLYGHRKLVPDDPNSMLYSYYQIKPDSDMDLLSLSAAKDKAKLYNDNQQKIYRDRIDAAKYSLDKERLAKQFPDETDEDKAAKIIARSSDIAKAGLDAKAAISRQIMDTDIKKANEMAPTIMVINFNELDDNNNVIGVRAFAAGVKGRLIATDAADIIDRIVVKNKTKVSFLNLIRATTGEIHFIKDFLLCLNQAKIDAKNAIKKGEAAQMWKTLEKLSAKNNLNKLRRAGNDASAITTLVLNQETVNLLKKQYDFDLEKIKNAWQVMDAYNLLGIVIADEAVQVAKFIFAGYDRYEQQAYNYLERENDDKHYKKIINLIGQAGRF